MKSEDNLKKVLKKAKRKHLLTTAGLAVLAVLATSFIIFQGLNFFTSRQSDALNKRLYLYEAVASPNIQTDSQTLNSHTSFGGEIIMNRSKNLDGYIVPWSTLVNFYSLRTYSVDFNGMRPSIHEDENNFYLFDRQTKQKTAVFYNPAIKKYDGKMPNELEALSNEENKVAEAAISFTKPMTVSEVEDLIPDNLNIVWLYAVGEPAGEAEEGALIYPDSIENFGFAYNQKTLAEDFEAFCNSLKEYAGNEAYIKDYLKKVKNTKAEELEISGVMLTGQAKTFGAIANMKNLRTASVGATAEMVNYIQPEK